MIKFDSSFRKASIIHFAPRYKMGAKGKYIFKIGKGQGKLHSLYLFMQGQDDFLTTQSMLK